MTWCADFCFFNENFVFSAADMQTSEIVAVKMVSRIFSFCFVKFLFFYFVLVVHVACCMLHVLP